MRACVRACVCVCVCEFLTDALQRYAQPIVRHLLTDRYDLASQRLLSYKRSPLDKPAGCPSTIIMQANHVPVLFSKPVIDQAPYVCAAGSASLNARFAVKLLRLSQEWAELFG